MRRILFDVPRWHVYLHREARELPPVEKHDSPERQLEDELFDRLYSGGSERMAEPQEGPLAEWAAKLHGMCEQLPAFERLTDECLDDEFATAAAVEGIMGELAPHLARPPDTIDGPVLRRAITTGCDKSSVTIENLKETTEALGQVSFGGKTAGNGTGVGHTQTHSSPRQLAVRLKNDERLRRIALLAGKFKRIAARKQKAKVRHGADEVTDVEMGSDLSRLLPVELVGLVHPLRRLVLMRDLVENRALQYRMEGTESLGKGPLVVCLDKSGSMHGASDVWATAVALALLDVAQRQRRPFALIGFDSAVKHEAFVAVGEPLPEEALFVSCVGGTNIGRALGRGLNMIREHPGALKKADLVLITDGASDTDSSGLIRRQAAELGVTVLGFGIGVDKSDLAPWCDEAHAIQRLDDLDDQTAEKLFTL
jgi:Mg-chelatase subunit ChlD